MITVVFAMAGAVHDGGSISGPHGRSPRLDDDLGICPQTRARYRDYHRRVALPPDSLFGYERASFLPKAPTKG